MNFVFADISGKVTNFDYMACAAITSQLEKNDSILLFAPYNQSEIDTIHQNFKCGECKIKHLINLVPIQAKMSVGRWKRILKALEGVLNYIYIYLYVVFHEVDVLHLAWLPYIDYSSIEYYFLKAIKFFKPKLRIVLTVHDVYPHNISEEVIPTYRKSFSKVCYPVNKFIVHTASCKRQLIKDFGIDACTINIGYHPMFEPKHIVTKENVTEDDKFKIIMYGIQTPYKGADILVDAVGLLSHEYQDHLEVRIMGKMAMDYYEVLKNKSKKLNIDINPNYIQVKELQNSINNSNIIILPYRSISQSGVLLTALYYRKIIITSDLPSFKETLDGFKDDWFFKSNEPQDLARLIALYLDRKIDLERQENILEKLRNRYSWNEYAKIHIMTYKF